MTKNLYYMRLHTDITLLRPQLFLKWMMGALIAIALANFSKQFL